MQTYIDGKKVFDAGEPDRGYQDGGFALPAGEKLPDRVAPVDEPVAGEELRPDSSRRRGERPGRDVIAVDARTRAHRRRDAVDQRTAS